MRRVLAPGGRCVILDFGKPRNPIASALYQAFLRTMMPFVGWLFHRDPETYLYIPESLARYPGQVGVRDLMREPASRTPGSKRSCSGRWASTSAKRRGRYGDGDEVQPR